MRIAIIGAGFAGLAAAWKLLALSNALEVTLFDGGGSSASRTAAGLLHPFVGASAKYNWRGREGLAATKELLAIASEHSGKPIFREQGLLRLALTERQRHEYRQTAELHPEVSWLAPEQCRELAAELPGAPGIFISNGITVYSDHYIDGLLAACKARGARLIEEPVASLSQLAGYDVVIIAAGAATARLAALPLQMMKGQLLTFRWPEGLPPLPCPISSIAYLVMGPDGSYCHAGSSYERTFEDDKADMAKAKELLMEKIGSLYPPLAGLEPVECRAAVRTSTADRRPLCRQIGENCWVFSGLGSKGLLYHALLAGELAKELLNTRGLCPP